jgi:hypothetical protein
LVNNGVAGTKLGIIDWRSLFCLKMMKIPNIGEFTKHNKFDSLYSNAMPVRVLGGHICQIVLDGYEKDPDKEDFHVAITNFLSIDRSILENAEQYIFQYYQDVNNCWQPEDPEFIAVASPQEVWKHIQFGNEIIVTRREYGDRGIYISLHCECDWEQEHGLEIIFKNGLKVSKIGACNNHLTNSDAYADDSLENVIYHH